MNKNIENYNVKLCSHTDYDWITTSVILMKVCGEVRAELDETTGNYALTQ